MADDLLEHLSGRLLVAVPGTLEDPNFRRTVVLMLEHGQHGALGVVLNRPSETRVDTQFPGWDGATAAPSVFFVGGPVQPQSMVIALARPFAGADPDGWQPILADPASRLGTVDLDRHPIEMASSIEGLRVFAGYAGWSAGQVESEIALGAWWVLDAAPGDAFSTDPDGLWSSVLRRQGGKLAMFAACPPDPGLN